jgi:hypothetical protein
VIFDFDIALCLGRTCNSYCNHIQVLLLREYRYCYDALVDTLECGHGTLGECVYAIENAAKIHKVVKRSEPIGFITDLGEFLKFKSQDQGNTSTSTEVK